MNRSATRPPHRFFFLVLALLLASSVPDVAAQTAPPVDAARSAAVLPSDQPFASYWFPNTLLAWSPEADADAPYNRSAVPLRSRFTVPGLQANDHARLGEAGVNPLSAFAPTSGNPSQGSLTVHHYAFGYWPYVENLIFWGGSAGEGLILAPNPGVTDAAHRHGVPVLGTVFFPPTVFGGQIQWVRDFVQRDGDTFPVADKMIEVAAYYGFDGWFINQETAGGNAALATDIQDMMIYLQQHSDLTIEWYDAMTESGSIFWQEELNAQNDAFFQQGDVRVSDLMFLDFGWTATDLANSNTYAQSLGRDPYELYAGVDYQARGIGIGSDFPRVFPEGEAHRTSLGIYRPDETFTPNLDQFYARERQLWVGSDGDPSREDAGAWKGIAHYIPAATSIDAHPFVTHFGVGQGYGYFVDGENRAPASWAGEGWNNLSLQDVQPTWRWWVETAGEPITVRTDFDTAYQGGSSLRLEGDVAADQLVRLFQTDLDLTSQSGLSIAYRLFTPGPTALQVGLTFADDLGGVTLLDLGGAQPGWYLETLNLAPYAGRTLAALSLFMPASAGPGFAVNVGRLGVLESDLVPGAPTTVTVERRTEESPDLLTLRLRWNAPSTDVSYYEVYRRLPDDTRQFLGGSSSTAYFVPALSRLDEQAEIPVEVVAVSPTGARSEAGTATVSTFVPPAASASLSPADDATGIALGARLTWAASTSTTAQTLYFGTSPTPPEVASPEGSVYDPGTLDPNTTYYWRVDASNVVGTTEGPLWSFTTGTESGTGDAALDFDGVEDFVDLGNGDGVRVTGSAITIEARVNPSSWRGQVFQGSVVNKEQNGPDNGYAIRVGANGTVNLLLGNNGWRELSTPSGTLVLNTWQHVAVTYDGATERIFVDGDEVASRPVAFTIADSDASLYVGNSERNPNRTFPGQIDEVRLWNVARSGNAIRATMGTKLGEAYTASPDSGLVGYWRFDEGSGQTVVDETAFAAHGSLGASTAVGDEDPAWTSSMPVSAEEGASGLPDVYALDQNYPNPLSRATTIRFDLPQPGPVRLAVYDLLGRRVAVLVDEVRGAGRHSVRFGAAALPSGVYIYRMTAGAYTAAHRLVLTR